jgi:hypothetical protein
MTATEFTIVAKDHNLGITKANPIISILVIGLATGLATGRISTITSGNLSSAGVGKGAEFASLVLGSGLSTVDVYSAVNDTVAPRSQLAPTVTTLGGNLLGTASGPVIPTLSGIPKDDYLLRVEIVSGGASPVFRYSLDDGDNWIQQIVATPGTAQVLYAANSGSSSAVSSGVSIVFPVGAYVTGDVFNAVFFAGSIVLGSNTAITHDGSLSDAMLQVASSPKKYSHIVVADSANGGTDSANSSSFSAVLTQMQAALSSLTTNNFFSCAYMDYPRKQSLGDELDVTFQGLATALPATGVFVCAGYGRTLRKSSISNANYWRGSSWSTIERMVQNASPLKTIYTTDALPVATHDASLRYSNLDYSGILSSGSTFDESLSVNSLGGTSGAVTPSGFLAVYRSLHSATVGAYTFLRGYAHCDPTNDFFENAYRLQFNAVLNLVFDNMWQLYKGQHLETYLDGTGRITESQAKDIESTMQRIVTEQLVNNKYIVAPPPKGTTDSSGNQVNTNFVIVDRTANLISTEQLTWICTAWAPAYVHTFKATCYLSL